MSEGKQQEPYLYAIAVVDGEWMDGESRVFSDRASAQNEVDSLNDNQSSPIFRLVPLYRAAQPAHQSAAMRGEQIKYMVDRFLAWKLPENFNPDGGISFKRMRNEQTSFPAKNEPVGTNLFDATQTEEMIRYLIDGMPAAAPVAGAPERKVGNRFVIRNNELVKLATGEVLPEWEPLFLFRARDYLALPALLRLREAYVQDGCTEYLLSLMDETIEAFRRFTVEHPEWMKQPGVTKGKVFTPAPVATEETQRPRIRSHIQIDLASLIAEAFEREIGIARAEAHCEGQKYAVERAAQPPAGTPELTQAHSLALDTVERLQNERDELQRKLQIELPGLVKAWRYKADKVSLATYTVCAYELEAALGQLPEGK